MFIPLNLFKTETISPMSDTVTTLPIPMAHAMKVCTAFGDECIPCDSGAVPSLKFSRLVISYSGYSEIVKVNGCSGGIVNITRGDEGTTPLNVPSGACVSFQWTAANLECAIIQVASGVPISIYAGCGTIDLGEGVPGPQGPIGDPGPSGPNGNTGPSGSQGPQGNTGPIGPEGPRGQDGLNGLNGTDGGEGTTGAAGPTGAQGPQGPSGAAGPSGLKGDTGPDGTNGTNGINGTNGATAYDYYLSGGGTQTEAEFAICMNTTCPGA